MQIKINLDLPKQKTQDYTSRLSKLETLIRQKNNSEILDEIRSIRKLLAKKPEGEKLDKRLGRIENKLSDIPEAITNSKNFLSKKVDSIDFGGVEKSIKTNTNKILSALMNQSKPSTEITNQLDIIEKKLGRLSLPKAMNINVDATPKRQVVPYPA